MTKESSFARFGPAIILTMGGLAAMSAGFASDVIRGGTPITADTYGSAVYQLPALAWCGIQFTGALIAAFGAYIQGRLGAWLVLIGATLLSVLFAIFVAMAGMAPSGSLLFWGTFLWSGPQMVLTAALALRHLRGVE